MTCPTKKKKKKKGLVMQDEEGPSLVERGTLKAMEEMDDHGVEVWAGFFEGGASLAALNALEDELKVEKTLEKEYVEISKDGWIPVKLIEKYIGFGKLKKQLAGKKGVRDPGGLAAAIGKAKYGKEKFKKAAAKKKKMKGKKATFPGYKGIKFGKGKKRARKAA